MNRTRRSILLAPLTLPMSAAPLASAQGPARPADRNLVAYFSRSGNTRVVAGQISRALGADLFEIDPAKPYPADYFETVEHARQERESRDEPPLRSSVSNMASYRTVFLGFPIWGETTPPVIRTFLSTHDLAGKTLIPVILHGGYGPGSSPDVLRSLAPRAKIIDAFILQGLQERQTATKVAGWLHDLRI